MLSGDLNQSGADDVWNFDSDDRLQDVTIVNQLLWSEKSD